MTINLKPGKDNTFKTRKFAPFEKFDPKTPNWIPDFFPPPKIVKLHVFTNKLVLNSY